MLHIKLAQFAVRCALPPRRSESPVCATNKPSCVLHLLGWFIGLRGFSSLERRPEFCVLHHQPTRGQNTDKLFKELSFSLLRSNYVTPKLDSPFGRCWDKRHSQAKEWEKERFIRENVEINNRTAILGWEVTLKMRRSCPSPNGNYQQSQAVGIPIRYNFDMPSPNYHM